MSNDDSERSEVSRMVAVSRRALRTAFARKFPELLAALQNDWTTFRVVHSTTENFDAFADRVEALAGAAGQLGESSVANLTRRLQAAVSAPHGEKRLPSEPETAEIGALVEQVLDENHKSSERETLVEMGSLASSASPVRRLVLISDDAALIGALIPEFELRGFDLEIVSNPDAAEPIEGAVSAVVIEVHLAQPGEGGYDLLELLNHGRADRLPTFLVASEQATHPEGHVVFTKPVDPAAMAEAIANSLG